FIAKRAVGGSAKDLELVVHPTALGLAFRFLVGAHVNLLFRRCRKSGHSLPLLALSPLPKPSAPHKLKSQLPKAKSCFLAGPLGFEPRQSAPKALDLPLVDGPVGDC